MKQFNKTQFELLHQLGDGQCHSGSAIGERLGISRTAVWKQISQLAHLGLEIIRIPQQGYQLAFPFTPLNSEKIAAALTDKEFSKPHHLHLFAVIDSTNRYLKELVTKESLVICCSEMQTHGRGRFGRAWFSPFGQNIYCSLRWPLNCCLSQLSGLSLVVGLAIVASLRASGIQHSIQLKWPNDLFWENKKLGGILIEVNAETNSCSQVILGIGINVNSQAQGVPIINQPWGSLHEMSGPYYDRNVLIANLIYWVDNYLERFLHNGFGVFRHEWEEVDYLKGNLIKVSQPNNTIRGYACGVNELGQLSLRDAQGKMHYLSSGDTSIGMNDI